MFLGSFTKYPFQSTADLIFKSVLCGRYGTVNHPPFLNIYDFKIFGRWKYGRGTTTKLHARILRKKGEQKKKSNMFIVEGLISVILSYQYIYIIIYFYILLYIYNQIYNFFIIIYIIIYIIIFVIIQIIYIIIDIIIIYI